MAVDIETNAPVYESRSNRQMRMCRVPHKRYLGGNGDRHRAALERSTRRGLSDRQQSPIGEQNLVDVNILSECLGTQLETCCSPIKLAMMNDERTSQLDEGPLWTRIHINGPVFAYEGA
jgi:hypothetical protein